MKLQKLAPGVVVVAVLTLAWVLWPDARPRPVKQTEDDTAVGAVAGADLTEGSGSPRRQASEPASTGALASRRTSGPSRGEAPPRSVLASEVLATVNTIPVKLRDLMPVRPEETEKEMTREQYAHRLQRAIETELIFQAARAEGVELTQAQRQRLEKIAGGNTADLARLRKLGVSWSSADSEQLDFEKRLTTAQMLDQNLVAKKAGASPSPDPEKQARYEQARRELLDQLRASAQITKAVPEL